MNRDDLLDLVRAPGAALLDGWSDSGRWTIALPEPVEELRIGWGEENRLDDFLGGAWSVPRPRREDSGIPFLGGWVGFISYEVGSLWEGAPRRTPEPAEPAALFYRHESGYAVSPEGKSYRITPDGVEPIGGSTYRPAVVAAENAGAYAGRVLSRDSLLFSARREPDDFATRASRVEKGSLVPHHPPGDNGEADLEDSLPPLEYERAHDQIREGIARGDFYQVNLTRRFSQNVGRRADPVALFRRLAGADPPPYSALIRTPSFDVVSASPELFLRASRTTGRVEMRPIKGTAPRLPDVAGDRRASEALLASAKDRAENVMIVDLCRNDLGRVCEPGSVRVSALCRLRSHRLHHLESTVEGRLRDGVTPAELLRATFPPGSVTGAPKRAAVGAIARLEPVPRGIYTGAIGFLDDDGGIALNVAIRTALSFDREVRYHAGGGITWDSRAESERLESEWKAKEFFSAAVSLRRE